MNAPTQGRAADCARRRQRVIKAINQASRDGADLSASAVARAAGVDRSFLYRHRDLLDQIHQAQTAGPPSTAGPMVSRESLKTDLANAHARNLRQQARVQQLEKRLSELIGKQAWHDSGLGAPADIDTLQRQITVLEQRNVELAHTLGERERDLAAARAANRELMFQLNAIPR